MASQMPTNGKETTNSEKREEQKELAAANDNNDQATSSEIKDAYGTPKWPVIASGDVIYERKTLSFYLPTGPVPAPIFPLNRKRPWPGNEYHHGNSSK